MADVLSYKFQNRHVSGICLLLALWCTPQLLFAQKEKGKDKEDLGNKEYIIVKDYRPVLGESYRISDLPLGDTSSATPPVLKYQIDARKFETNYEAATIKAVRLKDESLQKLYRNLVKLGLGNYTTYNGELYVNSLRSKKGALGLMAKHFSGSPSLTGVGDAGFSSNVAGLTGKYFLENATFDGKFSYNRDMVHYYGYNSDDTIINKADSKQRFSTFGFDAGIASNNLDDDRLKYGAGFGFSTISDLYDVTETDFHLDLNGGKKIDDYFLNADASFNYFKKSDASYQPLTELSDLSRNLISFKPTLLLTKDRAHLELGFRFEAEKNDRSKAHLFPVAELNVPISEHILSAFAGVDGKVIKNTYATMAGENPFITSAVIPLNTTESIQLHGGLKGNITGNFFFAAWVRYSKMRDVILYVNDSTYFNKFNVVYDDGSEMNLHAELGYRAGEKLNLSLHVNQYSYNMDLEEKAWQKPLNDVSFILSYNLRDKVLMTASVYARGKYYVRKTGISGYFSEKVNGYVDGNLALEYRYSKILSVFLNLNNLGFSRYQRWYQYPSERLNLLGGFTYSF